MSTDRLRERLAQMTLELVRIPSVTGDEREIAHHLERWALSHPSIDRDDVIRHGNNLVIGQPDTRRPCIALVGHIDTVPPVEPADEAHVDGDTIVGRGSSDMKGGIAVMQALFDDLDVEHLPFALLLILYDREEGPFDRSGLGPLLDELDMLRQIDLAIVLEPTDNTLQLGCLGAVHARVTFSGRASHSARPWEGDNAIHKASTLISRVAIEPVRLVTVGDLTFRESTSITLASGGTARNVIPDRFELNLNYRFAPTTDIQSAVDLARKKMRELAAGAEIDIYDVAPPGPVPHDNPILDHLRLTGDLDVQAKEAWTDVARLAIYGIDAVNLGPGLSSQAHQAGEWASASELVTTYRRLAAALTTPLAITSCREI